MQFANKEHRARLRVMPEYSEEQDYLANEKLIIVMVGLPARGKSYVSRFLKKFIGWMGYNIEVFNVGALRRNKLAGKQLQDFFDPNSKTNTGIRDQLAMTVLENLIAWLKDGGHVGIHDATNSTEQRRQLIIDRVKGEKDIRLLFLESVCTDNDILERNIRLKLNSPDYRDMDDSVALADFKRRLRNYTQAYEEIKHETYDNIAYIKLINVGRQVMTNRIEGYLPSNIVTALMNYHINKRKIFLVRHGESLDNLKAKIGGDSVLSPRGETFAIALAEFVNRQKPKNLTLYTSALKRTAATGRPLKGTYKVTKLRVLNEIYAGACEGLTYKEISEQFPEEYEGRQVDKLRYRYPGGGESYVDLIERLKPMIIEVERQKEDILIIGHQAILRTLYAYFRQAPKEKLPFISVPLHQVIELSPAPYGMREVRHTIELDSYMANKKKGDPKATFWNSKELSDSETGNLYGNFGNENASKNVK